MWSQLAFPISALPSHTVHHKVLLSHQAHEDDCCILAYPVSQPRLRPRATCRGAALRRAVTLSRLASRADQPPRPPASHRQRESLEPFTRPGPIVRPARLVPGLPCLEVGLPGHRPGAWTWPGGWPAWLHGHLTGLEGCQASWPGWRAGLVAPHWLPPAWLTTRGRWSVGGTWKTGAR